MDLMLVSYKVGMKSPVFNARELGIIRYGKAQAEAALPYHAATTAPPFRSSPQDRQGTCRRKAAYGAFRPPSALSLEVVQIFKESNMLEKYILPGSQTLKKTTTTTYGSF